MFRAALARPGVREESVLRSTFGFMAYHGGELEQVTDVVAAHAAARAGASYYGVRHPDGEAHVPSRLVEPDASPALARFLAHVEVVVTVHGYGKPGFERHLLLGGRNRALAHHVAGHLSERLDGYDAVADLEAMPVQLRGQHRDNPVNRPRHAGVQIELPALVRWHREAHGWSDTGAVGRAPQVEALIEALAGAARSWPTVAAVTAPVR